MTPVEHRLSVHLRAVLQLMRVQIRILRDRRACARTSAARRHADEDLARAHRQRTELEAALIDLGGAPVTDSVRLQRLTKLVDTIAAGNEVQAAALWRVLQRQLRARCRELESLAVAVDHHRIHSVARQLTSACP